MLLLFYLLFFGMNCFFRHYHRYAVIVCNICSSTKINSPCSWFTTIKYRVTRNWVVLVWSILLLHYLQGQLLWLLTFFFQHKRNIRRKRKELQCLLSKTSHKKACKKEENINQKYILKNVFSYCLSE